MMSERLAGFAWDRLTSGSERSRPSGGQRRRLEPGLLLASGGCARDRARLRRCAHRGTTPKTSRRVLRAPSIQGSGSLDGVVPGRHTVGKLIVGRLSAQATQGLRPLEAFTDLRELELEWPISIDLTPVTTLPLEVLRIENGKGLDLSPISQIATLKSLQIVAPRDCALPVNWSLSPTLPDLMFHVDRDAHALLQRAISAIPWPDLPALEVLSLGTASRTRVDLGFLAQLPQLRSLHLHGLRHRGSGPSPLEPPFPGLPPNLIGGLIEVADPHRIRKQLIEQRGLTEEQQDAIPRFTELLSIPDDDGEEWSIQEPDGDGDVWSTYGSFYFAAEGQDGETEHDALEAAKRRLQNADPALLRSLEFDPESDGTGIYAPTREHLERALGILGLRAPN